MLSRLVKDVWNLDSFIIEVQSRYPDKFTKEALEVIFDQLESYPGYCCIETLTEDFEEWTFEKFVSHINKLNKTDYSTENINHLLWDLYGDDGDEEIVRVLYETETIVLTQYFEG